MHADEKREDQVDLYDDDEQEARLIYMGATYLPCYRGGDIRGANEGE